jgi:hypothetical protein
MHISVTSGQHSGISGCLRNCRPDTPEFAEKTYLSNGKSKEERDILTKCDIPSVFREDIENFI